MPARKQLDRRIRTEQVRLLALVASAMTAATACDRIAGTNPGNTAVVQRHFDSLAMADSAQFTNSAAQDSLSAIREVQRRTDSILALTRPELAPPSPTSLALRGRNAAPAATQLPDSRTTPRSEAEPPTAGARITSEAAVNTQVTADVQRRLSRAQIIGDSIANAKVEQIVGHNRTAAASDSIRGTVQLTGSAPGTRPVLVSGGSNIALTGIAGDGLQNLDGAEVVVRGMRVSPRDIVVSSFSVRAMKGVPVLDGRLTRSGKGWSIVLSDRSGTRTLSSIPEMLQAAAGARVWIDAANSSRPQTYGIIARR